MDTSNFLPAITCRSSDEGGLPYAQQLGKLCTLFAAGISPTSAQLTTFEVGPGSFEAQQYCRFPLGECLYVRTTGIRSESTPTQTVRFKGRGDVVIDITHDYVGLPHVVRHFPLEDDPAHRDAYSTQHYIDAIKWGLLLFAFGQAVLDRRP